MLTVVTDDDVRAEEAAAGLDEIVRDGARRMLIAAIEMEASGYVEALTGELDEHGHRLVVRNGHAEPRTIVTAAGGIEIQAPRVDDRRIDPETGERWRAVNGSHLVALVRAGAKFEKGVIVERPNQQDQEAAA